MKDFVIPGHSPGADITDDRDLGTPARDGPPVSLSINGIAVTMPAGTSVMRAAALAGIAVPKLCASDNVEAFGSCRLCVVEIEGRRGTPASCTTPVDAGMVVHTRTDRIDRIRRGVMELYVSDHPPDCLTCAANGDCELQDAVGQVGLRDMRYAPGANHFDPSGTGARSQAGARLRASFAGVSYALLDEMGSVQWPCNAQDPEGTPLMHVDGFVSGRRRFMMTGYVVPDERTGPAFRCC